MSYYSPSIEKLIESFERLPSIGHKTAARLAFYILNSSEEETNEFINSIKNAKANLKYCSKCYNISDTDPCTICANPKRFLCNYLRFSCRIGYLFVSLHQNLQKYGRR